jgi:tetratricopeptide (TPR) repeat protein
MKPRQLLFASVSAVLLAAIVAAPAPAAATPPPSSETTSKAASTLLEQALGYQRRGAYAEAIAGYSAALNGSLSDRLRVAALHNRALAHQQAGHSSQAIDDFSSALRLNPALAHAYYGRANVMRETGNLLSALSDYEMAVHYKYPVGHLPLFGQALTYELLNRPLSAEKLLQQTLQLKRDFTPAAQKLAQLQATASLKVEGNLTTAPSLSVSVNTQSVYSLMTNKIDQIVASSVTTVRPDQVVRKASLPEPVRPPSHLLDAAEQVEVANIKLHGLRSISFAQTPASISPAFIVTEKTKAQKIQDRVPQLETVQLSAGNKLRIEPVSAPVEYKTRAQEEEQAAAAIKPPGEEALELDGFLIQINSQRSERAAWAAWKKFQEKYAKLLADREAIVQKANLGSEGVVYRLRIRGLPTRDEATALCSKLKSQGLACFVARAKT